MNRSCEQLNKLKGERFELNPKVLLSTFLFIGVFYVCNINNVIYTIFINGSSMHVESNCIINVISNVISKYGPNSDTRIILII